MAEHGTSGPAGSDAAGPEDQPQVFALRRRGSTWETTRRGFLAAVGAASWSTADSAARTEQPSEPAGATEKEPNLTTAKNRQTGLFAHHQAVTALGLSADGSMVASGSPDGTVKLWSLADGSLRKTHTGWTGELLRYGGAIHTLIVDNERQTLISTAGEFADEALLRNVPDAAVLRRLRGFSAEVTAVAVAAGGGFIAIGTARGKTHLFAKDGQLVQSLEGHAGSVTAVAVTPDGKCVVAYSLDETILRWIDGRPTGPVTKEKTKLATLAVTPDGERVLWAGSEENHPVIHLWSVKEGKPVREFKQHLQRISALLVAPDGATLLSGDAEGRLWVWDLASGERLRVFGDPSVWKGFLNAHTEAVRALAVSPESGLLASGSRDKKVKLWSLPAGKHEKTLDVESPVRALAISPDNQWLVAAFDKLLKVWPLPECKDAETWPPQEELISGLAFTPDSRQLAVALLDGTVRLWSFADRREWQQFRHPNRAVYGVAISQDGKVLAAAAGETAVLWSLPEGRHLRTLTGHTHWVKGLTLSADSQLLATASLDKTVRVWSLPGGEPVGSPDPGRRAVLAVAITPDGTHLAAGGDERAVCVRPPRGEVPWRTLGGHAAAVGVLVVTPDGKTLFSGSADGVIAIWDLPEGRLRGYLFDRTVGKTPAVQYTTKDGSSEQDVTFTLPRGAPVPTGAVCVCNTIGVGSSTGTSQSDTKKTRQVVSGVCVCDQVCTCNTICTCNSVSAPSSGGSRGYSGHYWFPS